MYIYGLEINLDNNGYVISGYSYSTHTLKYLYKRNKYNFHQWDRVTRKPATVRKGLKSGKYAFY